MTPCPICNATVAPRQRHGRYACTGCGAHWTPAELKRRGKRARNDHPMCMHYFQWNTRIKAK